MKMISKSIPPHTITKYLLGHENIYTIEKEYQSIINQDIERICKMEMIKINIEDLKRVIRRFNNKSISIYINGIISGKVNIHKAKCVYTPRFQTIVIYDKLGENRFKIEINALYKILTNKIGSILEIKLENDEELRIEW